MGKLHAHIIVVGFNHFFGHDKTGNFDSLYMVGKKYGFRVEEIPEQEIQNEIVSSTIIRRALLEGNIQRANAYLQHLFLIQADLLPLPVESGQFRKHSFGLQLTVSLYFRLVKRTAAGWDSILYISKNTWFAGRKGCLIRK